MRRNWYLWEAFWDSSHRKRDYLRVVYKLIKFGEGRIRKKKRNKQEAYTVSPNLKSNIVYEDRWGIVVKQLLDSKPVEIIRCGGWQLD